MRKKIVEDEKRILTLISEFQKLNDISTKQDEELVAKENLIIELQGKLNEKNRHSIRSSLGKNSEVFSEKSRENDKVCFSKD